MDATIAKSAVAHPAGGDLKVIEHMLARGEIVASQLPQQSLWSREKKLAAAAFTAALINIRDNAHVTNRRRRREVAQDVEWVLADDTAWPYSFLRLCELFQLDPEWVRDRVRLWLEAPQETAGRRFSAHRHAA